MYKQTNKQTNPITCTDRDRGTGLEGGISSPECQACSLLPPATREQMEVWSSQQVRSPQEGCRKCEGKPFVPPLFLCSRSLCDTTLFLSERLNWCLVGRTVPPVTLNFDRLGTFPPCPVLVLSPRNKISCVVSVLL